MICKNCNGQLYRIRGLCLDRDGIREAAYCDTCNIIFSVHASGDRIYKVFKEPYSQAEREQIISLCESIIEQVTAEMGSRSDDQ